MGKLLNTFYNALAALVGITKCSYFHSGTILFRGLHSSIHFFIKSKHPFLFILLLQAIFIGFTGCKRSVAGNDAGLTARIEDVTCTEAWLHINTGEVSLPITAMLKTNNTPPVEIRIDRQDTVLFIEGLPPGKQCTFTFIQNTTGNTSGALPVTCSARTMDTTGHNITWQSFSFGVQQSYITDIHIYNENNILAAGIIYLRDSTGRVDPLPYGFLRWDGKTWTPFRQYYYDSDDKYFHSIEFANFEVITDSLMYMANGNVHRWDAKGIQQILSSTMFYWGEIRFIERLAYISPDRMFGGGGQDAALALYNGTTWKKLPVVANAKIQDMIKVMNPKTGGYDVYFCTTNEMQAGDRKIFRIDEKNTIDSVTWPGFTEVVTLWSPGKWYMFAGGDGLYENKTGKWRTVESGMSNFVYKIKGAGANDVFIAGYAGSIMHYNGNTWHDYTTFEDGAYSAIALKGNLVVLGGGFAGKAGLRIGRRN